MEGQTNTTGGIPLNVTLHAWPVPQLESRTTSQHPTAGHVATSPNNASLNHRLLNFNTTFGEDDITDTGFTDVQTLILAGVATLIPLLIAVATVLTVRLLWRRYKERKGEGYEGVMQREESSEPLSKMQVHSLAQEFKSSESQFTVTPGEEAASSGSPQVMTPKSNGSVITMTLKNNHLIVETEEATDTLDGVRVESQGTTTKYVTPSTVDIRSPDTDAARTGDGSRDHGALVHRPAEEESEDRCCNTGLSQSDLSQSSSGSNNPSYRYGNQSGYDAGGYGYPEYAGYSNLVEKTSCSGPMENQAFVRSPSQLTRTDSVMSNCEVTSPRFKDVLCSDIQARKFRTKQNEEDRLQKEQEALGNGEVTPTRRSSDATLEAAAAVGIDRKRASLPNFGPLPISKGSKFEQHKNEMSPLEEVERHPTAATAVETAAPTNS